MRFAVLLLLVVFSPMIAFSQYESKSIEAVRCTEAPKLNGLLDDPCWIGVPEATGFIMSDPNPGVPLQQPTSVKIVYDDEAVYVGFMNYDDSPDSILQQLSGRDVSGNADNCAVIFSCYRDGINGVMFSSTPRGEQTDLRIGASGEDINWNAVWVCRSAIVSNGWSVEFKIPFSALRFHEAEKQLWNINFKREVRRNRHSATWRGVDPLVTGFLTQMGTVTGINGIKPPPRVFLFPYSSGYLNFDHGPDGKSRLTTPYNIGMDLKMGLSDAFTLDAILIPDFGQVISDQLILNLTPFEVQFQDFRQFFTEGTELFSKAGIFYSRRIGGTPPGYYDVSSQLKDGEKISVNPQKSKLINATKVSGRQRNGLGIGVFNAISSETFATVIDTLGNSRLIQTAPVTNYNVFVLDKNLKNNSYVSLINTNVTRAGGWMDANVTGYEYDLRNKGSKYNIGGSGAYSRKISQAINGSRDADGFKNDIYIGKLKGNFTGMTGVSVMSDTFDPSDLGFITYNNYVSYWLNVNYNIYKPFLRFNKLWSNLGMSRTMLYHPYTFIGNNINAEVGVSTKKFHAWDLSVDYNPIRGYDYFEPRVDGMKFMTYRNLQAYGWFSSDYRRVFALDLGSGYRWFENDGRYQFNWRIAPRWRVNDHILLTYVYSRQNHYNDLGWSTTYSSDSNSPVFGRRDVVSHTNVFNVAYSINPRATITCRFRHYWGFSKYKEFYGLAQDGSLVATDFAGFTSSDGLGMTHSVADRNFNSFTIDLISRWIFAPGSELSIVWKNAIVDFHQGDNIAPRLTEDIDYTFSLPQTNSVSVKVLYFLDYRQIMKKRRAEEKKA